MDLERRLNGRWNLAVSFDRLTPSTHPLQRNTSALVILPSHRLNQGSFHFLNGRRSRRSKSDHRARKHRFTAGRRLIIEKRLS